MRPEEEAATLAQKLVESRVAACVTMVPGARSVYRWQGAIEEAAECLLIIKLPSRQLFETLCHAFWEDLTRMTCPNYWPCRWWKAPPNI